MSLINPVMAPWVPKVCPTSLNAPACAWTWYLPGYLFLPPMFAFFKQTNPAPYLAAPGRNRLVKPILGRPGPRPQERRTPGLPLPRQLVPRHRPPATPSRLNATPVNAFPNSSLYFPLTLSSSPSQFIWSYGLHPSHPISTFPNLLPELDLRVWIFQIEDWIFMGRDPSHNESPRWLFTLLRFQILCLLLV